MDLKKKTEKGHESWPCVTLFLSVRMSSLCYICLWWWSRINRAKDQWDLWNCERKWILHPLNRPGQRLVTPTEVSLTKAVLQCTDYREPARVLACLWWSSNCLHFILAGWSLHLCPRLLFHALALQGHGLTASIQDFLCRSGPSLFSRIHLTSVLRPLKFLLCAEWIWVLILSDTCWLGLGVMPVSLLCVPARQNMTAFLWGWYGMTSHTPVNVYTHTNKLWPRL